MNDTVFPRQVREQIARANEIGAAMLAEQTPDPAPQPPPTDQVAAAPAPAAPAAPTPSPDQGVVSDKQGTTGDAVFWRNNYLAMKGRADANDASSRQAVQALTDQVTALTGEIAKLKQPAAQAPATTPAAPTPWLTDADRNRFGDGVVDLVERGAKAAAIPEVQAAIEAAMQPLREENARLAQQMQQHGQAVQQVAVAASASEEDKFFAALDAKRPDWEQINAQQAWLQWLDQRDAMTGVQRQLLVSDAITKRDLHRLLAVIENFAGPYAATPTQATPDLSPAPRTVGAAVIQTNRDDNAPLVTRTEIATFYQDSAAGRYRNRPADKQAMETKIADALRTGRVGP